MDVLLAESNTMCHQVYCKHTGGNALSRGNKSQSFVTYTPGYALFVKYNGFVLVLWFSNLLLSQNKVKINIVKFNKLTVLRVLSIVAIIVKYKSPKFEKLFLISVRIYEGLGRSIITTILLVGYNLCVGPRLFKVTRNTMSTLPLTFMSEITRQNR